MTHKITLKDYKIIHSPFIKIAFMTAFDIQLEEFRDIIPAININDIIKKPYLIKQSK
jgi:hypothetical protein